ncbi:hypothetical protein [Variovorax fucosicus]|uniref:hypothetical protein n=1 Tax=Variovorax fucosicus TaxID=3053517 RepID=UPI0025769057|nr:hypothetical protein [Variovorax sp. J22G47]MDM0058900.1 hypothetical protein [Variovorax sp. J22G47]
MLAQEIGIVQLERRDPPEGNNLRACWSGTHKAFEGRILPFTAKGAMLHAPMHVADKKSIRGPMIAATALSHGFTVVTHNAGAFEKIAAIKLFNPWECTV